MSRIHLFGLVTVLGSVFSIAASAQEPGAANGGQDLPPPLLEGGGAPGNTRADERVKPLMEGPLHEAFLSPRKDRGPVRIEKAPPAPLAERPGIDPPNATAEWIEGYWEWDPARKTLFG